jgi:rfaE bifunctional protein nucleotidyltransferase chain/domain
MIFVKRSEKIILQAKKVVPIVKKLRAQGKKIVLTQGSFDLVHIGHCRYLAKSKEQGDVLIVGVDSDEKIQYRKGKNRPVVPQAERLEMLTYLDSVDYVILKELDEPKFNLTKLVRPDVLIAVEDTYALEAVEKLKEFCRRVMVLPYQATTSTSAKIRRVQIGAAKDITKTLSKKFVRVMEEMLEELKNGDEA